MQIAVYLQIKQRFISKRRLEMWLQLLLQCLQIPAAGVTLTIVSNQKMIALNHTWRGKRRTTDVLSFPIHAQIKPSQLQQVLTLTPWQGLGDIAISAPQTVVQARLRRCSLEDECLRLIIHGLLHCCGHDHQYGGQQARLMQQEESRLFAWVCQHCSLT